MSINITSFAAKIFGAAALAFSVTSMAADEVIERTLCVFDPIGANGPLFDQMKDYKVASLDWGVDLKMVPYTDERVTAEDFKAGKCDAMSISGIRARQFNSFTGTLDSIGSMPTYDHLKMVLGTLLKPKASKYMVSNSYEITGIIPAGAAYLFVNDRQIQTVSALSGKRIAYLDNDDAQKILIGNVGASPVASSIANMFSKFNNGSVDIVASPAALYEAMELYKGLDPNGGIIRFALAQLTIQMVIHRDRFPEDFGQQSRSFALEQFDQAIATIKEMESDIPDKWWVDIPEEDKVGYNEMFRQSRITLRDQGIYNGKALTVFRVIRCKKDPTRSECTAADKE